MPVRARTLKSCAPAMRAAGLVAEVQGLMAAPRTSRLIPNSGPGPCPSFAGSDQGAEAGFENLYQDHGPTVRSRPSTGHVDLGTGIRTALGQIVAEELDVSLAWRGRRARRYLTGFPIRGATIASENHPDNGSTIAQSGSAGAAIPDRARRRRTIRNFPWTTSRIEDGPDPRPGQSQHQLWRIDCRRERSPGTG